MEHTQALGTGVAWVMGALEEEAGLLRRALAIILADTTEDELAQHTGVSPAMLAQWRADPRAIPAGHQLALAGTLVAYGRAEGNADLEQLGVRIGELTTHAVHWFLLGANLALEDRSREEQRARLARILTEMLFVAPSDLPPGLGEARGSATRPTT